MIDIPDAVNQARALIEEKRFDEAIVLLRECREACPEDEFLAAELAEACTSRGFSALRNGDGASARADFQEALKYSPLPEARLGLARFDIEEGNLNRADDLISEILSDQPDFFPARELRARLRMSLGDDAGAEEEYRAILEEVAVPRVCIALADLLRKRNRPADAHEILLRGLSESPDDADLVLAAARQVTPEEGWRLLNRALAVHFRSFPLWFERARVACLQNDPEEAAVSLNRCLELDEERTKSAWKEEVAREESPCAPHAEHPYLRDF